MKEATCPLQEILCDSFEFEWSKEQSWTSELKKKSSNLHCHQERSIEEAYYKKGSPCNFRKAQMGNRVIVLPSVNLGTR
jgi:hypothetical protein